VKRDEIKRKKVYNFQRDQQRKDRATGHERKLGSRVTDPTGLYSPRLMDTLSTSCKRLFEKVPLPKHSWVALRTLMLVILDTEWEKYDLDKTDRRNDAGEVMYRPDAFERAVSQFLCRVEGLSNYWTMKPLTMPTLIMVSFLVSTKKCNTPVAGCLMLSLMSKFVVIVVWQEW